MSAFTHATAPQLIEQAFPPFITALGVQIEQLAPGRVTMRLPFNPDTSREGGIVSGQALAALADTAMVCALWAGFGRNLPVATIDLHVTYLRAAYQEDLHAVAEVIKSGRSLSFAKVSIAGALSQDKPVATAIGTFAVAADKNHLQAAMHS